MPSSCRKKAGNTDKLKFRNEAFNCREARTHRTSFYGDCVDNRGQHTDEVYHKGTALHTIVKQVTIARVARPSSPANENRWTSLCGRRKQCAESSGEHACDLPTKISDCGHPKAQTQGLRCLNQEATHQRVVMWALGQVTWSNLTFIAHSDDNPNTHFLRPRGHI